MMIRTLIATGSILSMANAATYLDTLDSGKELTIVPTAKSSQLAPVKRDSIAPQSVKPSAKPADSHPTVSDTSLQVVPEKKVAKSDAVSAPVKPVSSVKSNDTGLAKQSVFGYRIQIYSSSSYDAITEKKKDAEKSIDLPIYTGQENGLWKLYVGDYVDHADAEKNLPIIKQLGYPDAWVVPSKVKTGK